MSVDFSLNEAQVALNGVVSEKVRNPKTPALYGGKFDKGLLALEPDGASFILQLGR